MTPYKYDLMIMLHLVVSTCRSDELIGNEQRLIHQVERLLSAFVQEGVLTPTQIDEASYSDDQLTAYLEAIPGLTVHTVHEALKTYLEGGVYAFYEDLGRYFSPYIILGYLNYNQLLNITEEDICTYYIYSQPSQKQ